MIELSARSFIHDLRIIRQLLRNDANTLMSTPSSRLATDHVCKIINRIEDFNAFYEALSASAGSPQEADLGSGEWDTGSELGSESYFSPASSDGPPGSV